jgi:hypothetical protein
LIGSFKFSRLMKKKKRAHADDNTSVNSSDLFEDDFKYAMDENSPLLPLFEKYDRILSFKCANVEVYRYIYI